MFSMVHAAIYDAVNGIDKRNRAFGVTPTTDTRGASKQAVAAAATHHVPVASQAATFDATRTS